MPLPSMREETCEPTALAAAKEPSQGSSQAPQGTQNTYLLRQLLPEPRHMSKAASEKTDFSDEDVENILDMRASKDLLREFRKAAQESPLLVTGLAFAFGLLVGVSLCNGKRRSR
jgi:hypothetical protein